jgi:hypothetical protein
MYIPIRFNLSTVQKLPLAALEHSSQSVALVFASEPDNLSAAQSVQTEAPAAEYLPFPPSCLLLLLLLGAWRSNHWNVRALRLSTENAFNL